MFNTTNHIFFFYGKTNEMHHFLKFILSCNTTLHVSEVFPSIIRSLRLYIQHQVYVKQILLTACYQAVHLFGFTIEIYHDARPCKREI